MKTKLSPNDENPLDQLIEKHLKRIVIARFVFIVLGSFLAVYGMFYAFYEVWLKIAGSITWQFWAVVVGAVICGIVGIKILRR